MEPTSKQKHTITVTLIVISGVVGFYFGSMKGIAESKDKISELNQIVDIFVPPIPDEVFSIHGEVKSINGDTIILEITSLQARRLPTEDIKKEIRQVVVSSDTEITRIDFPTFNPSKGSNKPNKIDFEPKEVKIALADLKTGDTLRVTSQENIKSKESFLASRIQTINHPRFTDN